MQQNLTSQTKITDKYQTVIPSPIRKRLAIKRGGTLVWKIVQERPVPMIFVLPKPEDWSSLLSGLGKEVWQGINTEQYLEELKKQYA